jgi:hypothetical protein
MTPASSTSPGANPRRWRVRAPRHHRLVIFVVRVLITLLPAIPVLFMDEPESPNLISVTLLFGIGYAWAGYIGISRLPLGIMIIAAGLTLSDSPGSADGRSGQRQHRGLRVGDAALPRQSGARLRRATRAGSPRLITRRQPMDVPLKRWRSKRTISRSPSTERPQRHNRKEPK